jgi:hypothetical protein
MPNEIELLHQFILIEEVCVQANLAILAHDRLLEFISDKSNHQRREVWGHIQSFLSHAAMISKYVGTDQGCRARAEFLKTALAVEDNSPLLDKMFVVRVFGTNGGLN